MTSVIDPPLRGSTRHEYEEDGDFTMRPLGRAEHELA